MIGITEIKLTTTPNDCISMTGALFNSLADADRNINAAIWFMDDNRVQDKHRFFAVEMTFANGHKQVLSCQFNQAKGTCFQQRIKEKDAYFTGDQKQPYTHLTHAEWETLCSTWQKFRTTYDINGLVIDLTANGYEINGMQPIPFIMN